MIRIKLPSKELICSLKEQAKESDVKINILSSDMINVVLTINATNVCKINGFVKFDKIHDFAHYFDYTNELERVDAEDFVLEMVSMCYLEILLEKENLDDLNELRKAIRINNNEF